MSTEINHEEPTEPFARQRIEICRQCEHYAALFCKKCGCFMPLKTRIRQAQCPLGKWVQEDAQ